MVVETNVRRGVMVIGDGEVEEEEEEEKEQQHARARWEVKWQEYGL